MLIGLRLQNIALIDALELSFDRGFTVITGETGAGKSILLDALDALLGGAQGTSGVRLLSVGVDRAQIEASFALNPAVEFWLKEQEFDLEESELVLSREWRRQDNRVSSRYRLNGVAVNRQQMFALRPLLIDLTMQGQTQQLARPGQQRRWLDCFAGAALENPLAHAKQSWRSWQQISLKFEQARANFEQLQRQRQTRSDRYQPAWQRQRRHERQPQQPKQYRWKPRKRRARPRGQSIRWCEFLEQP